MPFNIANLLKGFGPTSGGTVGPPPASPVLTLADNGNDTGATATLTGADAGTTNAFYAAPWSGGMIPGTWTSYGSRSGNGTKILALVAGYYWVYCLSTGSDLQQAVSNVAAVRVTTGALSVYEQCLNAVLAKIQGLSLSGIDPASIVRRKLPWERRIALPGYIVSPPRDTLEPVNNGQNDLAFDCLVTGVRAANEDLAANLSAHLSHRQTISDAFQPVSGQAALAGVPAVHDVQVIHGPVYDGGSFSVGEDVQQLTVRCVHRRNRGLI